MGVSSQFCPYGVYEPRLQWRYRGGFSPPSLFSRDGHLDEQSQAEASTESVGLTRRSLRHPFGVARPEIKSVMDLAGFVQLESVTFNLDDQKLP